MTRKKQTRGKCVFCEREMTKGGLSKHLKTCPQRMDAIHKINSESGKEQAIYHLQAQDAWHGDFWLHLEMRDSATLEDLDHYLRWIWLECCGHMSRFSTGGWGSGEISKQRRIEQIFMPDLELTHIYDFGTESETRIKMIGARKGKPLTPHPIFLMARNDQPEAQCVECDKPASRLCIECIYEMDEPGTLCETHAEDHPHYNYGEPMVLVNSPRTGMCGYDGPAEPPY
ncbi:MAG: hypothetical protein GY832_25185 [Chloroflexi bacterium]|nr:hypothetical protein [Chloroflexota bacterium]